LDKALCASIIVKTYFNLKEGFTTKTKEVIKMGYISPTLAVGNMKETIWGRLKE